MLGQRASLASRPRRTASARAARPRAAQLELWRRLTPSDQTMGDGSDAHGTAARKLSYARAVKGAWVRFRVDGIPRARLAYAPVRGRLSQQTLHTEAHKVSEQE